MFLHYKRRFQTCLQMLGDVREQFPELRNEILSYAGVLDPMAEGWVPVLVGKEENQDRVRQTESIKEYVVQVLVGVSTDSGDLMGIITSSQFSVVSDQLILQRVIDSIYSFSPLYKQKISRFANKKYNSKPLWWYQLNGVDLPEEALVEREVQLYDREVFGTGELSKELLIDEIGAMAEVFGSTFRMERILPSWDQWLRETPQSSFAIIELRVVVSKGFFVRQWVQDIAKGTGLPMVVWKLKRTKVFGVSSR